MLLKNISLKYNGNKGENWLRKIGFQMYQAAFFNPKVVYQTEQNNKH